uniref:Uncharacterized protein n=1 Tax=Knufia peltigerae TaxID=1002370 RepID=A0AA38XWC5_9EURO|nr:hypothetical protein H2204_010540 [Knufia peltigerae]
MRGSPGPSSTRGAVRYWWRRNTSTHGVDAANPAGERRSDRFDKSTAGLHPHRGALAGIGEMQAGQGFGEVKGTDAIAELDRFRLVRVQHAPLALLTLQSDQHALLTP